MWHFAGLEHPDVCLSGKLTSDRLREADVAAHLELVCGKNWKSEIYMAKLFFFFVSGKHLLPIFPAVDVTANLPPTSGHVTFKETVSTRRVETMKLLYKKGPLKLSNQRLLHTT